MHRYDRVAPSVPDRPSPNPPFISFEPRPHRFRQAAGLLRSFISNRSDRIKHRGAQETADLTAIPPPPSEPLFLSRPAESFGPTSDETDR